MNLVSLVQMQQSSAVAERDFSLLNAPLHLEDYVEFINVQYDKR